MQRGEQACVECIKQSYQYFASCRRRKPWKRRRAGPRYPKRPVPRDEDAAKKIVPFSVIEAGGCRATFFGVLPSLLNTQGSDDVAMQLFTVTVTFEWTLPWTNRRQHGETKQKIDIRQFADVFWRGDENHAAKAVRALEGLEYGVREAVGREPSPGREPSAAIRQLLRGARTAPR